MTETLSLFGQHRATDPNTAKAAASRQQGGVEQAIVAEFVEFTRWTGHSLTDDELVDRLPGWYPPTVKS